MNSTNRLLLAGLAVVLVSSLAVAALWPGSNSAAAPPAVVAQGAVAAPAAVQAEGAIAANSAAEAPSSNRIFPKVLHR